MRAVAPNKDGGREGAWATLHLPSQRTHAARGMPGVGFFLRAIRTIASLTTGPEQQAPVFILGPLLVMEEGSLGGFQLR